MEFRVSARSMVVFLIVYAAVAALFGVLMAIEHLTDTAWEALGFSLILVLLFGIAAVFMFKWKILGYWAMICALAWQILIGLIGFDSSFTSIASFVYMLMVNLFIIVWLLQDEQRTMFH